MKTISIARRLGVAVVALAGVLALAQPIPAEAAHGGGGGGGHGGGFGGGFHGGGFGGSGGFHGGGFSGGGFHANAMGAGGAGGFHGAHFGGRDGFRQRGGLDGSWGGGSGWDAPYYDYGHDYGYPDYGSSGYSQPHASQYWYYCQNPSGYYPYVQQCTTNWQPVPAG